MTQAETGKRWRAELLGLLVVSLASPAMASELVIEVLNAESNGYIQLVVDGAEHVYEREVLDRDAEGKVRVRREKRVWQAGPSQTITVRRKSWSSHPRPVSVMVKYFDEDGRLIGITSQRLFRMRAHPAWQGFRWTFRHSDIARRGGRNECSTDYGADAQGSSDGQ